MHGVSPIEAALPMRATMRMRLERDLRACTSVRGSWGDRAIYRVDAWSGVALVGAVLVVGSHATMLVISIDQQLLVAFVVTTSIAVITPGAGHAVRVGVWQPGRSPCWLARHGRSGEQ
ncbi:hypothetical protein [Salinifilum ghardaiensis]